MNDGNSTDSGKSHEEFGTTLAQAQEHFSKCDKIFNELYEKITAKVSQFVENNSLDCTSQMPNKINEITDHLRRTLLHAACENGNYGLACFLLKAGPNPNAKETCGITPLCIAVIEKNKQL